MCLFLITAAAFSIATVSTPTIAAPCKDAKGKFMKCPPKAAAPAEGRSPRRALQRR